MPSYAQLEAESWWRREVEPPNLRRLTDTLRAHYNVGSSLIGAKGDLNHLSGFHRSREWILNSRYSDDRGDDYSVQHVLDRSGDARWLCAIDFQTGTGIPALIEVCKRLDVAVRADRFPQIREWYGNLNGDRIVDGWNNVTDRPASSDSSHLFHLHMSFHRSRADWDHSELLAVLTGKKAKVFVLVKGQSDPSGKVFLADGITRRWLASEQEMADVRYLASTGQIAPLYAGGTVQTVANLGAYGVELGTAVVTVDAAAVAAALAPLLPKPPVPPTAHEIAVATLDEDHKRSAG